MPPARGWRIAAAVWAGAIAVSGVLPTRGVVHAVSGGRDGVVASAGHFAAYALLGFLLGVALGGREPSGRVLLKALALAAALGAAVEVVQAPLSYRDAQLSDFVVDVAGAAVGLAAIRCVAWVRRSRSRRG
jgi:VanZ family protein